MKPFTVLLCLALLSLSSALSPKPLIPESCNATEYQAGLLLEEINKDRDEGYVFSLFRVVDVHRQPEGAGDIFYFTVDVLETECPVISGKSWRDCEDTPFHQTVFGQCKAVIYLNKPWRKAQLDRYNCTLSTVPPELIVRLCPDCPVLEKDLEPYEKRAERMVVKYNRDSNNTHYFKLDKLERASMQWMFNGPSYFPEFSIKETNCARLTANVSECESLEDDKALVGFCKGSLINLPGDLGVEVTCTIYDPKQTGHHHHHYHHHGHGRGHGHGHEHEHEHGHRKGHKHHHHPRHHHHHHHHHHPNGHNHTHTEDGKHHHKRKHEHKHRHGPPNGEPHKHHDSSSEEQIGLKPGCKLPAEPISSIQYIFMSTENDFFPVPSIPDPLPPAVPSGAPSGSGPVGPSGAPESQPFPHTPSNSTDCPGEPKKSIPHIASLLPVPK